MSEDGTRPEGPAVPAAFPWAHMTTRPARDPLDRARIVAAALALADREGLEALSMRRLGQELGAGATSLYWHVRSKDELLDLVLDQVIGEVVDEIPTGPGTWREHLADTARALRRVLVRHAPVAVVMGERPTVGPNALSALDWLMGLLGEAGFDDREALLASSTVINWAASFAVFEVRDPTGPKGGPEAREAFLHGFAEFVAGLPDDRYANTKRLLALGLTTTADEQFEYALTMLLDGIEARLRRQDGSTTSE